MSRQSQSSMLPLLIGGALAWFLYEKNKNAALAIPSAAIPAFRPNVVTAPPAQLETPAPTQTIAQSVATPTAPPQLNPDNTLLLDPPHQLYPTDLWEPRDGELLGPGPTMYASDAWEPVTPQTQAGAGYEFGGIYRVQELGNGPLTCLTHSGKCGDASSVYAPVGTVVENTRDGSTYTVNS